MDHLRPEAEREGSGAAGFAVFLAAMMLWAVYVVGAESQAFVLSVVSLVFGSAVGWLVGTVLSPYTDDELKQFTTYAKMVATGLGGFLARKFYSVFNSVQSGAPLPLARAVSTAASALLVAVMVSVFDVTSKSGGAVTGGSHLSEYPTGAALRSQPSITVAFFQTVSTCLFEPGSGG